MSDELLDELRLIGCHTNGDARCTCGIGQDAISRIEALTAENAALRAALEWYGQQAAMTSKLTIDANWAADRLRDDRGKKARAALFRKATP